MFDRSVIITDRQKVAASQNIKERDYWLNQLSGELIKSAFPVDVGDTGSKDRHSTHVNMTWDGEFFSSLMKLSNGFNHVLHMIFVAGVTILLGKYSSGNDIIVGAPIYKQEIEGEFINTVLALRNPIHPHMTFKELLIQVKQTILGANENQNYPIEALLYNLNLISTDLDKEFHLFDTVVLLESIHDRRYFRHIHVNMIFSARTETNHIEVELEYNPSLYKNSTAQRILNHLKNVLCEAVSNVEARVFDLNVLSFEERNQILYEFNDTAFKYTMDKTLHQLFEEQAVKTPDNTAVICDNRHITYRTLNERANRLAWMLKKKSIGTGSFVGVVIDRSVEMVTAVMGIIKAGAAYVPQEPDLPESRIGRIMASLNVQCIICNPPRLQKIGEITKKLDNRPPIVCLNNNADAEEIGDQPVSNVISDVTSMNIAYVIHTSGSTGTPKGVVEQHRPGVNIIEWVNRTFRVGPADKVLCVASLGFDLSVYDIFGLLASGGSISVVSGEKLRDPYQLLDAIYKEGITFWDSAPAALQQLVPFFQTSGNLKHRNCFRLVFLSGDWIPVTLPDRLRETFEKVKVIALGGATEATIWSNNYPVGKVDPGWPSIPYGKPIQNASYYILDKFLQPCSVGVPGDLFIGGQCLALGYINEVELTAFKFIANPFVKGERIYRTGDMARWFENGNMEFLGRLDFQVKIRGHRIELGEIENQLLKHEDIETAIVITKDTGKGNTPGSGKLDKYLCAYYVAGKELDGSHLKTFLSRELPDYMIPSYFIRISQIPLSPSGKLDRKALPEPGINEEKASANPRNEVDENLIEMWAELLNIPKNFISIERSFFDLGGHSLSATELVSKIHQHFNVKLPLMEVFTSPTIRQLSDYISNSRIDLFNSIEPAENKEYYPLSSAQKGLFLTQQIDKESTGYNIPFIMVLEGNPDNNKLEYAFRKLIERHESFRTSFDLIDGEPVQRIHREVDFNIEYFNKAKAQNDLERTIRNFVRPFDLMTAPLLRIGLIKAEEKKHFLMVDMHHIISDGISIEIIRTDLIKLYAGEEREMPQLTLQYKDFSVWQNGQKEQEVIETQRKYWLETFNDYTPSADIPTDYPRPKIRSSEGSTFRFEIGEAETEQLNSFALKEGTSLFMLLFAIYNVLFSKLIGQEVVVVGTGTAGRRHVDLNNIVGLFMNTIPLRNYPHGDSTFIEFLHNVTRNTLNAFENQDYIYEELLRDLNAKSILKRDVSRNPLFDTMFALENYRKYPGEEQPIYLPGLKILPYEFDSKTAKFDLFFIAYEVGKKMIIVLEYSTALFKPATIEKIKDQYIEILNQVLTDNHIKLKDVQVSKGLLDARFAFKRDDYSNFDF